MKLSDERARAIAELAIRLEAAKDKARAKLVEEESLRRWDNTARTYVYPSGEDAWKRAESALYHARADRDSKRRSYQRQIKSALMENVS